MSNFLKNLVALIGLISLAVAISFSIWSIWGGGWNAGRYAVTAGIISIIILPLASRLLD